MARRNSRKQQQKPSYSNDKKQAAANSPNNVNGENPKTESTGKVDDNVPDKPTNGNDPEWYMRDLPMVRDAASIYFSYSFGKDYYLGGSGRHLKNASQYAGIIKTPGICVLRTKPTFGFSDGAISPLNVSANSIYAYVRHMNSGRKNYDPADLLIYLAAIANLYSAIVWAERLYNFAFSYSNSNRFIGDSLLRAEGVDPDNFRLNLANYRLKLNEFINKVSVFAVPSDITYFNKCAFMYRDVFLENGEGNIRDQMYFYVPDGFYKFALDSDNIGMLDYVHWNYGATVPSLAGYTDVINLLEDLLAGIFEDEDASLMSGDLFKVYGDRIIRLTSLGEDGILPLVYDPMVLWQMKNANPIEVLRRSNSETVVTSGDRTTTQRSEYTLGTGRTQKGRPGCVFQRSDGLLMSCERTIDGATGSAANYDISILVNYDIAVNKILTSDLPNPSVGVVMESSRMMIGPHDAPVGYTGNESNPNIGWIDCGSFLVMHSYVAIMQSGGNPYFSTIGTLYAYTLTGGVPTTIEYKCAQIFMFKYFPMVYAYRLDSSGNMDDYYPISDIANFAILDASNVDKLHETALLSLLYVPGIARIG